MGLLIPEPEAGSCHRVYDAATVGVIVADPHHRLS